jgi:exodeoxyribonuclease-3
MKVATWNVNSLRVRLDHLRRWVDLAQPDVVALQETKVVDALFPVQPLEAMGFVHQAWYGQPTYNGVAILSRQPLTDVRKGMGDAVDDPQARVLSATVGGVRVVCCYVPNGTEVGSPAFHYKLQWLTRLKQMLAASHQPQNEVLVCGDINIAPDDPDVWDPFRCEGRLLCHPEERGRLASLLSWGLEDAWRHHNPFGTDFSWWDYRRMGFQRNQGLRIDHVFLTKPLMARCTEVQMWREVRGWSSPSDHIPVVAHLADR